MCGMLCCHSTRWALTSPFHPYQHCWWRLFSVTLLHPREWLPVKKYDTLCCPDFPHTAPLGHGERQTAILPLLYHRKITPFSPIFQIPTRFAISWEIISEMSGLFHPQRLCPPQLPYSCLMQHRWYRMWNVSDPWLLFSRSDSNKLCCECRYHRSQ